MDPGDGRAQGAVLSPLLSNIYLDPLDHLVAQAGFAMVRYADDFVILCRTPDEAARALELVQTWVSAAGLTLHPTKTKVVEARTEGFDFLGYHFQGGSRWPREKSLRKFQDTIRAETKRTNGIGRRSVRPTPWGLAHLLAIGQAERGGAGGSESGRRLGRLAQAPSSGNGVSRSWRHDTKRER